MRALAAACALAALGFACAYGHGIGSELLPPQDAGGRGVSVEIAGAQTEGEYQREFTFRAFDAQTGEQIPDAEYRIRAQKAGNLLFEGSFASASGALVFELEDGEGGTDYGEGLFGLFGDRRVRVSGPHFGSGGLYSFDVELTRLGAELDAPPRWKGGVSLLDVQEIRVPTGFGEQEIRHLSYYDTVENLGYAGGRISFDMPFDGTAETIAQTATVHEEVRVSKEFGSLMVSEISAEVNGERMPPEAVQIDDFADGYRTIHVVLYRGHLEELYKGGKLGSGLSFSVGPAGEDLPFTTVTRNGQYRITAEISPRQAEPGGELKVSYRIGDVFVKDRPVSAEHVLYAEAGGERFFQENRTSRSDGGYSSAHFAVPAGAQSPVHVGFERIGGSSLAEARLPVLAGAQIPEWVGGTVQLWVDGAISDAEFSAATGYLVSIGVIEAEAPPEAGPGGPIPGWIRETAGLWAGGILSDAEFVRAVEYLMEIGAIR